MSVNVYWAMTSYCPRNNYHIHPIFNFDLPTHWVEVYIFMYMCILKLEEYRNRRIIDIRTANILGKSFYNLKHYPIILLV